MLRLLGCVCGPVPAVLSGGSLFVGVRSNVLRPRLLFYRARFVGGVVEEGGEVLSVHFVLDLWLSFASPKF